MKIEVKDNNIEQALRVLKRKLQRDGFFKVIKLKNILFEIKKHTITKNVPSKKNIKKLRSFFVING